MQKSLIISRYNEDITWLEKHQEFNIFIYNKGKKIINKNFKNITKLKNVGRESHTWIYHIIKNYNNLDDVNIFMQGRIDDLDCMSFKDPNNYLKFIEKYGFCASRYGLLGPLHWDWHVGIEKNKKYIKDWEEGNISRSGVGFRSFSENLFPNIPIFVATCYGGCFAVKKELIRKYDLDFYINLLNILDKHKNPIEGHYMERLWCYMFTTNAPIWESIINVIFTKIERLKLNPLRSFLKI